ncbi:MAG: dihydroorotase [Candidatus Aenigmarchaeota archaeon]|nr:dihydroorotase [Candidatus Aenigmarchaeota archaeon]
MIDPHVHTRDRDQSYKETIEHGLNVAYRAGLSGIYAMPNTSPPVAEEGDVQEVLGIAKAANSRVFYGAFIGVTPDTEQVKRATASHRRHFIPEVEQGSWRQVGTVGLKMFAGRSVGDLTVAEEDQQKAVYRTLAKEGFEGALVVHCEKEEYINSRKWNPDHPRTHPLARPMIAEINSIENQIAFAKEAGYTGVLHIAHVSAPTSVTVIESAKDAGMNITCELTSHHCILSTKSIPNDRSGLIYKVNPPIRNQLAQKNMIGLLRSGAIDCVASDHAPHIMDEKTGVAKNAEGEPLYMSGFPGLPNWPHFKRYLELNGFSEVDIQRVTHDNVERIFGIRIPPIEFSEEPDLDLHGEYPVDVWADFREGLYA